eukprot:TRINITY_DN58968_c0_g1_i1.p1 TRINITY_DN58968_c0_g1~~TRINITY_DN58968_c0_g1_i1.p1  ORF type:complete len:411 (+),score=82.76 TRINITY_DN58968_c0_g1_i1:75-1307(+)
MAAMGPPSALMRNVFRLLQAQDRALELTLGDGTRGVVDASHPTRPSSLLAGSAQLSQRDPNGPATEWFWLLGTLLSLLGATLTTVGLLMQKKAHSEDDGEVEGAGACQTLVHGERAAQHRAPRPYWMRSKWLFGSLVWLFGNVICWLGMGMAPQSIVAVFDCWNIIVTLALAPWWFGETVTRRTTLGQAVVVVGCLWVIAFGPKEYHMQTAEHLKQACLNPAFQGAAFASASLLACMCGYAYLQRFRSPSPLTALQYTVVSANFAWYAAILSKCTAALIVTTFATNIMEVQNYLFLGFVCAFVYCAVGQIHFLNMGMKYGDAVVVIPVYMAMSMTGQMVVGGVIFFNEFAGLGLAAHGRFWPGVLCVLAGVVMLSTEDRTAAGGLEKQKAKLVNEATPLTQEKAAPAAYY